MFFWRKIVIFHTKYPNNFRASLRNWKKYDFFWRKIVIFHTKYQKKISRLPPLGAIFDVRPPLQLEILDPPLVYSVTDFVQKIGELIFFKLFLSYYDEWNVPWTAQKSLIYLLFSYQSVWNACCLNIAPKGAFPDSEKRQERRFNRKGVVMNIHRA